MAMELNVLIPAIQALGWALIHFLWQGLAIGALFAVMHRRLLGASPQVRYLLGLFCLLLLAMAPVVTFLVLYPSQSTAMAQFTGATMDGGPASVGVDEPVLLALIESALPWVVVFWGIGVLAMSGRVMVNWERMRRCLVVGVAPITASLDAKVRELCMLFGVRQQVCVLETSKLSVPTVLGWLRPVVLLPTSSLLGLTPGQLELVIAHELAHIRRGDFVFNFLQVAVETVLFYHPVVRWISRVVREEREKCCDDLVIARCGNRLKYAKALTHLETFRADSTPPALAATDGQLLQRIERIVYAHGRRPLRTGSGHGMVLALLTAFAVLVAGRIANPLDSQDLPRPLAREQILGELTVRAKKMALLELPPSAPSRDKEVAGTIAAATPPQALALTNELPREQTVNEPVPQSVAVTTAVDKPDTRQAVLGPPAQALSVDVAQRTLRPSDSAMVLVDKPAVSELWRETPNTAMEVAQPEPATAGLDLPAPAGLISADTAEPTPLRADPLVAQDQSSETVLPIKSATDSVSVGPGVSKVMPAETVSQIKTAPMGRLVAIHRVNPEYPKRALRDQTEGWVTVEFAVTKDGRVRAASVRESSPAWVFDRAARKAIEQWRFDTSALDQVREWRFTQTFSFTLGEDHKGTLEAVRGCRETTGSRICRPVSAIGTTSINSDLRAWHTRDLLAMTDLPATVVDDPRVADSRCVRPPGSRICAEYFLTMSYLGGD